MLHFRVKLWFSIYLSFSTLKLFSLLLHWFFCSWPSYIWSGRHWRNLRFRYRPRLHGLQVIGDVLCTRRVLPSCTLLTLTAVLLPAVLLSSALCAWGPWGGK